MPTPRLIALAAAVCACAAAPAAWAQTTVPEGRLLASNCFQCHGSNGQGPGFEKLSDKSAREIFKEMREMKSGEEGDDLMAHHARGYSTAQLRALSRYLARQR
jgi:cytochrome subunit of sulfide dehydrogenase